MSKRTDTIYGVTVVKSATMYVEADSVDEALKIADKHCSELSDSDFWDSDNEVFSCESYPSESDDYMENIYTKDGKMSFDTYVEQLNEQEDD